MENWWEIISVFLLSTVKFVFGAVPMALAMGFSFFEAVVVTSLGGCTGASVFVIMSEKIINGYKKRREKKSIDHSVSIKKKFTKKNKIIVLVKRRFGLWGVTLLTPLLLSIPLGCFIAVRYFKEKKRILIYMFVSILFWSIAISSFELFLRT